MRNTFVLILIFLCIWECYSNNFKKEELCFKFNALIFFERKPQKINNHPKIEKDSIYEKMYLNVLIIKDSNLISIIDSFLVQEFKQNNYNSSYLIIDICNSDWGIGEKCLNKDTMLINVYAVNDRKSIFLSKKEGVVEYKDKLIFLQGILLQSLFEKSDDVKVFINKKTKSSEIIIGSFENLSWYFYYINQKFVFMQED
jgi:hypothetical protein